MSQSEADDSDLRPFDAAHYLVDDQSVRWFLEDAMLTGGVVEVVQALSTVVRARGVHAIATSANLSPDQLAAVLANQNNIDLVQFSQILTGLGLKLSVSPIEQSDAAE